MMKDHQEGFLRRKQHLLDSWLIPPCSPYYEDRSIKGNIDLPIYDLVHHLNSLDAYMTTSSCSGRISIRSNVTDKTQSSWSDQKFWWVSHDPIENIEETCGSIVNTLDTTRTTTTSTTTMESSLLWSAVSFKFEPAILHVECKDIPSAQRLHQIALESGFRNSGLCLGRKHIMLAIRDTASLEVPLIHQHAWIVQPHDYLPVLFSIANQRFLRNQQRLTRLKNRIDQL
jgi:tRNA wybutosine-synthesizing protein 3